MHSVAFVGASGDNAVQKHHVAVLFGYRHREVADSGQNVGQLGQLVVVGCEKGLAPQPGVVVQVFDHRPGYGHAIVGAGPPAHFVQDDQGFGRSLVQDGGGFHHFNHESRLP